MRIRLTLDIDRRRPEPSDGELQHEHRDTDTLVETPWPRTGFSITPSPHLEPDEHVGMQPARVQVVPPVRRPGAS